MNRLEISPTRFLRVQDIIGPDGLLPISKSAFYELVASGRLPQPIRLSKRLPVWREDELLLSLNQMKGRHPE